MSEHLLADERQYLLIVDEAREVPDASQSGLGLLTIADNDRQSPFLLRLAGQPTLEEHL